MTGQTVISAVHLNHCDMAGGAARAAYRIHRCLRDAGTASQMWVDRRTGDDPTVQGPVTRMRKLTAAVRPSLGSLFSRTLTTGNSVIHSPALLPSHWPLRLNRSDADIVHLHWLGAEMLSVGDIGRIRKPIVWTLHDMWAFCGAEHYSEDERWRVGYRRENRPAHEAGFDLNRWVWKRKRRLWRRPMHIVAPSRWLADCVRASALMKDWPVAVIPNPIDTDRWRPVDRGMARELLGLPKDERIVLFGAIGGGRDPRKGLDLLERALQSLHRSGERMALLVAGQSAPVRPVDLGFPVRYTGYLYDDVSLRILYSAADVFVLPSRQDNLPNTAIEAHACGTPVVAFDIGGLADIVCHERTGYLAKAFDIEDLARGIRWVMQENRRPSSAADFAPSGERENVWQPLGGVLSANARRRAIETFSYPVVAGQYLDLYERVLAASA